MATTTKPKTPAAPELPKIDPAAKLRKIRAAQARISEAHKRYDALRLELKGVVRELAEAHDALTTEIDESNQGELFDESARR